MKLKRFQVEVKDIFSKGIDCYRDIAIDIKSEMEDISHLKWQTENLYNFFNDPTGYLDILQNMLADGETPILLGSDLMERLESLEDQQSFCLHIVDGEKHIGIIDGQYVRW